ncbi:MAG TPA: hypothetical protein VMF04_04270 [Thermoplasmata archaeon]|nr:hypothetical protein [Thermoplasmata archaeon]
MTPLIPASDVGITVATLLVSVLGVAVFAYVGLRLIGRDVSVRSRLASYQFSIWWLGLGGALAVGRIELALALGNALPFAAALTFSLLNVAIEAVYLWGLVGAFVYVSTGRYYLLWLGALYAAFYIVSVYSIFAQGPYGVTVSSGTPTLLYATPANGSLATALTLVVLVPEFVAACLYLSLLPRAPDRRIRWRISLVGSSILLWVAIHAFVPSAGYDWVLAKTVLDVLPAVLSYLGLLPPGWIRRKLGIEGTSGPEEYYRVGPVAP